MADTGTVHRGDRRLEQLHPLSKELIVDFSQNVPPKVPTDPSPSMRSPPARKTLPTLAVRIDPGVLLVAEQTVQARRSRSWRRSTVDSVAGLWAVKGDGGDVVFQYIGDEGSWLHPDFVDRSGRRSPARSTAS